MHFNVTNLKTVCDILWANTLNTASSVHVHMHISLLQLNVFIGKLIPVLNSEFDEWTAFILKSCQFQIQ